MLIVFGIGEHIELTRLCKASCTYLTLRILMFAAITATGFTVAGWSARDYFALCLLLAAWLNLQPLKLRATNHRCGQGRLAAWSGCSLVHRPTR